MAVQILTRRSSVLHDRPFPIRLGVAELAVNNNAAEPGLFFADDTASPSTGLIKAGPTFVGSTSPNSNPVGFASFSKGESWLDTSSTQVLKIFDGTNFKTVKAVVSNFAGFPSNAVDGQLHYNQTANALYMWNQATTAWVAI